MGFWKARIRKGIVEKLSSKESCGLWHQAFMRHALMDGTPTLWLEGHTDYKTIAQVFQEEHLILGRFAMRGINL